MRRHVAIRLDVAQQNLVVGRRIFRQVGQRLQPQRLVRQHADDAPLLHLSQHQADQRLQRHVAQVADLDRVQLGHLAVAAKALQLDRRHDPVVAIPLQVVQTLRGADQGTVLEHHDRESGCDQAADQSDHQHPATGLLRYVRCGVLDPHRRARGRWPSRRGGAGCQIEMLRRHVVRQRKLLLGTQLVPVRTDHQVTIAGSGLDRRRNRGASPSEIGQFVPFVDERFRPQPQFARLVQRQLRLVHHQRPADQHRCVFQRLVPLDRRPVENNQFAELRRLGLRHMSGRRVIGKVGQHEGDLAGPETLAPGEHHVPAVAQILQVQVVAALPVDDRSAPGPVPVDRGLFALEIEGAHGPARHVPADLVLDHRPPIG